jgi:hypothetical protein
MCSSSRLEREKFIRSSRWWSIEGFLAVGGTTVRGAKEYARRPAKERMSLDLS